jgi:hypothetical protein
LCHLWSSVVDPQFPAKYKGLGTALARIWHKMSSAENADCNKQGDGRTVSPVPPARNSRCLVTTRNYSHGAVASQETPNTTTAGTGQQSGGSSHRWTANSRGLALVKVISVGVERAWPTSVSIFHHPSHHFRVVEEWRGGQGARPSCGESPVGGRRLPPDARLSEGPSDAGPAFLDLAS